MAVDTPATIAILGAGPIGLEAALYARYLGYDVAVYERGDVAEHVGRWGHVRMFSPFRLNRSALGLAALAAHDTGYQAPADEQLLSGQQWRESYLLPLAATDLLADHVFTQTEVLGVARDELRKDDLLGDEQRGDYSFRILLRDKHGVESANSADVVIDTTGVYGSPCALGAAGLPAIGESHLRERISYWLPDVLGADRTTYEGARVLLVGSGYSAATAAVALATLAEQSATTRVVWVTRRNLSDDAPGPLMPIENDRLPERAALTAAANQVARQHTAVQHWPGTEIDRLELDAGGKQFVVHLLGAHAGTETFDRIIALSGYRPDHRLSCELQTQFCYATDGSMRLATALLKSPAADCLDQQSHGPQTLVHPEPHFYTLGAKSYGRNSHFLVSIGLVQIRDLFTIIGDRPDLDLYRSVVNLLP